MLLLILFIVLGAVGFLLLHLGCDDNPLGFILIFIGIVGLVLALIYLPFSRYDDKQFANKVHSTQQTIESFREDSSANAVIERAALIQEVIKINQDLADRKLLSHNPWVSIFYNQGIIDSLQPIK